MALCFFVRDCLVQVSEREEYINFGIQTERMHNRKRMMAGS